MMSKNKRNLFSNPETLLWKSARLTERDEVILQFINAFGFCEMPHLKRRFGLHAARPYQITDKLRKMGLLTHEYILAKRPGIFRVTKKGATLTTLPALKKVQLDYYRHHLTILNVYFHLMHHYPEAKWITERQLIHVKNKKGIGQSGHLPDGILKFSEDKQMAIEVELTTKGKDRLDAILETYLIESDFKEVWYYVTAEVLPSITELASEYPFVRIYNVEAFLP